MIVFALLRCWHKGQSHYFLIKHNVRYSTKGIGLGGMRCKHGSSPHFKSALGEDVIEPIDLKWIILTLALYGTYPHEGQRARMWGADAPE